MPRTTQMQLECKELINHAHLTLVLIARHYLKACDVDDAVQEAIKRFLIRCNQGLAVDDLNAFLHGILKNVIKEILDAKKNNNPGLKLEPPDPAPSMEEQVISDEQRELVQQILNQLSPAGRELLILHFVDKKSFAEMEKMLGQPHSNLYRQLKKCLKKFARELKKSGINYM